MRRYFKWLSWGRPVLNYAFFDTSLGEMAAAATEAGICRLQLRAAGSHEAIIDDWREAWPDRSVRKAPREFSELQRQLEAYLAGDLQDFSLPLNPDGTEFRLAVWNEATRIPYGHTITYGDLAARLGKDSSASRAVGNALGANPLPILIPCHRVLGSDGRLIGYGGGLELKTELLRIEGALLL